MKAKIKRGKGFSGVLRYTMDDGKQAEPVAGNMSGDDARSLSAEFAVVREIRPDIERPVFHCSLTLPAGEKLDGSKWQAVADDFMQRMEFPESTPWTAVRHSDTDHDHIHIVASRVSLDGAVWHGKFEAYKAIEATQQLEKEHGLTITEGREKKVQQHRLTDSEINKAVRTGQEPPRQKIQRIIDEAAKGNPTASQFAEHLKIAGVDARANIASTGKMNGFSFTVDDVSFKSSQLGKKYSWSSLQKKGISYVEDRDRQKLERLSRSTGNRQSRGGSPAEPRRPESGPGPATSSSFARDGNSSETAGIGGIERDHHSPSRGVGIDRKATGKPHPISSGSENSRSDSKTPSFPPFFHDDDGRPDRRRSGGPWSRRFRDHGFIGAGTEQRRTGISADIVERDSQRTRADRRNNRPLKAKDRAEPPQAGRKVPDSIAQERQAVEALRAARAQLENDRAKSPPKHPPAKPLRTSNRGRER